MARRDLQPVPRGLARDDDGNFIEQRQWLEELRRNTNIEIDKALNDLSDVNTTGVQNDYVLQYDASDQTWKAQPNITTTGGLGDLDNVNTTGKTDGSIIQYDTSSSEWIIGTISTALSDLSDVDVFGVSNTDLLQYDGSKWVDVPLSSIEVSFVPGSDKQVIFNDGGFFGADSGFTYDKTLNALTLGGQFLVTDNVAQPGDYRVIDGRTSTALLTNAVTAVTTGQCINTGSVIPGTGHGIGVWGNAEDTTAGLHFLIGTEGKCTGKSTNTNLYYGLVGFSRFEGPIMSPATVVIGAGLKTQVTTDGTTPLNVGLTFDMYIENPVGGDLHRGIYLERQTGANTNVGIQIDGASNVALWLSGDNGFTDGIAFGSAVDTILYRESAALLKTNADFEVGSTTIDGTLDVVSNVAVAGQHRIVDGRTSVDILENAVTVAVAGEFINTGSEVAGAGHGIGVWGNAEDTTIGNHFLIGTEGKVTGKSTNANLYYGLVGYALFEGPTMNAATVVIGATLKTQVTTDGTTPLNTGSTFGLYIENPIGADTHRGIYLENQNGATTNIGIQIDGATSTALWLSGDTGSTDGITFGSALDTNLYRDSAGLLKTSTNFSAAGYGQFGGLADSVQLTVTGNAAQTSDLFVVEDSGGTDILQVSPVKLTMIGEFVCDSFRYLDADTGGLGNVYIGEDVAPSATGNYNVGIGITALTNLTTGFSNVAIGRRAGFGMTTASQNFALGQDSLIAATTGGGHVAIGSATLQKVTTSVRNVAVGGSAGKATTGSYNVYIGSEAGLTNTGSVNTFIGETSGKSTGAASGCVAIGRRCGSSLQGNDNTCVGTRVNFGAGASSGKDNVYIGTNAAYKCTTNSNVLIGMNAAYENDGYENVAIGWGAAYKNVTGARHAIVGYRAGYDNLGTTNTLIGYRTGSVAGSSDYQVLIGPYTGRTTDFGDYALAIHAGGSDEPNPLILGYFDARTLTVNGTLDVTGNTTIGGGAAGVDYTLTFDGETNDGVLTWKEDEDYFEFADDVNIQTLTASKPVWTDASKTLISKDITACDIVRGRLTPSTQTVNTGTLSSGTVSDVQTWADGNEVHISEVTGVPGFDVEYRIDNVADFCGFGISFYYVGSSTHECQVQVYDDTNTTWRELYSQSGAGLSHNYRFSDMPGTVDDYINGSDQVKIRFYHPQSGNASHDLYIDYVSIIGTST